MEYKLIRDACLLFFLYAIINEILEVIMKKRITERIPVEKVDADASLGLNSEQVKERIEIGYI